MATIALHDIWQVAFRCRANDQLGINVVHFQCTAVTGTSALDTDLASQMAAPAAAAYIAMMPPAAHFQDTTVFRKAPLPAPVPFTSLVGAGPGTFTGDLMPRQVAGILTKVTAFAGRSFRGRVFVPFPSEDHNDASGIPTGGYVTRLTVLGGVILSVNTIIGAGGTAIMTPVVYQRQSGNGIAITTFRSNQKWATQRRRGSYGRPN